MMTQGLRITDYDDEDPDHMEYYNDHGMVTTETEVGQESENGIKVPRNELDEFTYSNIDEVQSLHLSLDLQVDFDQSKIYGKVLHQMKASKELKKVIMDYQGVNISSVTLIQEIDKNVSLA